ncbi:MAG: hypothetical protein FWE61_06415 [Micrococcales bacterium]|nr:hypothetical protein [Micrococcales bacterium]
MSWVSGQGWRLNPGEVSRVVDGVVEQVDVVSTCASDLKNVPQVEDYRNTSWGSPWHATMAGALDIALVGLAFRAGKAARVLAAATVGVSQAVATYGTANREMAEVMITEAVKAGDTNDFSFFEGL